MGHIGEPWVSDELAALLGELTAQQADGVCRIVLAELRGEPISSLMDCPGQICASTTYYGQGKSRGGWRNKPAFQAALKQARSDYRAWLMQHGAADTLVLLTEAGPPAVNELRRQATGDEEAVGALARKLDEAMGNEDEELVGALAEALGLTGAAAARLPLERALIQPWQRETVQLIARALAEIARAMDHERQRAAMGILDRIDSATASKAPPAAMATAEARAAGGAVVVLPDNRRGDRDVDEDPDIEGVNLWAGDDQHDEDEEGA